MLLKKKLCFKCSTRRVFVFQLSGGRHGGRTGKFLWRPLRSKGWFTVNRHTDTVGGSLARPRGPRHMFLTCNVCSLEEAHVGTVSLSSRTPPPTRTGTNRSFNSDTRCVVQFNRRTPKFRLSTLCNIMIITKLGCPNLSRRFSFVFRSCAFIYLLHCACFY